jgi:hypothetical protein
MGAYMGQLTVGDVLASSSVTCSDGYINDEFTPNGEFVLFLTYSAPIANLTGQYRDSCCCPLANAV